MQRGENLQDVLRAGAGALQSGRLIEAEKAFLAVLDRIPDEPNSLHLLGLVRKQQGRLSDAVLCLRKALSRAPNNPQIKNNLANTLKQSGDISSAESLYRELTAEHPEFASAYFNLGLLLSKMDRQEEAVDVLHIARSKDPKNPSIANALGLSLAGCGQTAEAESAYREALQLKPDHMGALHNLGCLLLDEGKVDEAVRYLDRAHAIGPTVAETAYVCGNAHYSLGDTTKAEQLYGKAIDMAPASAEAHEALNHLYWEYGRKEAFAASYSDALKKVPDSPELWASYIKSQEKLERWQSALETANEALATAGNHVALYQRRARIFARLGMTDDAIKDFSKAIHLSPEQVPVRIDFARLLIAVKDYEAALGHLETAQKYRPYDQEVWAYRGLAWRLAGDDRSSWLNDYDVFVKEMDLRPPEGYASLSPFLDDVADVLRQLHTSHREPLGQSFHGGTQTHGQLLTRSHPLIQKLRHSISDCVAEFVDQLPDDEGHPFLQRKTGGFRFSASWSIRLGRGGAHVNHVHPMGWLSSALYISVPDCVRNSSGDDPQGWLALGKSNLDLEDPLDRVEKMIKPEPGRLVLFPSYFWHGTTAFDADEERMTAPFDVVPD